MGVNAGNKAIASLSPRQREVLEHLMTGCNESTIAAKLRLSVHTVHQHAKAIYRRCQVHSRAELMSKMFGSALCKWKPGNAASALS